SYEGISGMDLKAKKVMPEVFVVTPNGLDDTPALAQAFDDAKVAGPGSIVKLVEGEYHVGYMEIFDFYGSLMGAGKDKTIITLLPGMDIDALWAQNLTHCQVKFVGGDVHMSNFTMQTPPGILSTGGPGWGHIYAMMNFSAFSAIYELGNESRSINVVIDNVRFKGHYLEGGPGYLHGYNSFMGVRVGFDCFSNVWSGPLMPREKIDFKITNSEFDTFCYGLALEGMKNSRAVVGEKTKGNIFNNLDQQAGVWESRDVEILIEGNIFNVPEYGYGFDQDDSNWYGNYLQEESSKRATLCNIQFNVFNLPFSEYALFLNNRRQLAPFNEIPVAYQIRNNQFNMTGSYPWAVVSYRTNGAVIRNNKFTGYGDVGLLLGTYSSGGLVLGNNFSTAEFSTAAVYLTPSSKDWTVVGGNIQDQLINLGINNIISGVNVSTSDIPLGRTIHDKLPPMNHLMH
ncbi:MAG: hypothetical protein IH591_01655, partial [Bacteroidales bacterium]|nr:hypothetical protein [Bacteroidales bacterium]